MRIRFRYGASVVAAAAALAVATAAPAADKLVVAADVGYAPHVMANPSGGFEGYNVDMIEEIARRLGVEYEIVDQEWSGIFAGLNAKKYDFIIAPTTVTPERSEKMLFMEGYLDSEIVFLVRADAPEVTSLEELGGKVISVNKGNVYDKWATERMEQYGWEMQRYGKNADAIQAVLSGRAFANIASGERLGLGGEAEPAAQDLDRGQHRAGVLDAVPSRRRGDPQQDRAGRRVHEARRVLLQAAREVVRGTRRRRLVHGHRGPRLRGKGSQRLRPDPPRARMRLRRSGKRSARRAAGGARAAGDAPGTRDGRGAGHRPGGGARPGRRCAAPVLARAAAEPGSRRRFGSSPLKTIAVPDPRR